MKRKRIGGFTVTIFEDVFTHQYIVVDNCLDMVDQIRLRQKVYYKRRDITQLTERLIPIKQMSVADYYNTPLCKEKEMQPFKCNCRFEDYIQMRQYQIKNRNSHQIQVYANF